jgi:hypothetical protein
VYPPPSPAWANFSIMMECTPESGRVSTLSAGAHTTTLYVMVDIVKGVEACIPPPPTSPGDNFSIMMECTPEISRCHSVYSVVTSDHALYVALPLRLCWPMIWKKRVVKDQAFSLSLKLAPSPTSRLAYTGW